MVAVLCLMTNHVHMIVTPTTTTSLAAFVKHVSQRFAQLRNAARGGSGKLFEERYKSICILTDAQLAATTAYIELNPVRARLVADPADYAWSSCAFHLGRRTSRAIADLLVRSPWYESLGSDAATRADAYGAWLAAYRVEADGVGVEPALRDPPAPSGAHRVLRPDGSSAR